MKVDVTNFKSIPLSSIAPAPLSTLLPNKMLSAHLKRLISHYGQVIPLYVYSLQAGRYILMPDSSIYVYKALVELGIPTAICCDCGALTQEEVQLISLQHSLVQFEPDDLNIAETLVGLNQTFTPEQLTQLIPLSPAKINTSLKLLNTDWDKLLEEDNVKREYRAAKKAAKVEQVTLVSLPVAQSSYVPIPPNSILSNY